MNGIFLAPLRSKQQNSLKLCRTSTCVMWNIQQQQLRELSTQQPQLLRISASELELGLELRDYRIAGPTIAVALQLSFPSIIIIKNWHHFPSWDYKVFCNSLWCMRIYGVFHFKVDKSWKLISVFWILVKTQSSNLTTMTIWEVYTSKCVFKIWLWNPKG